MRARKRTTIAREAAHPHPELPANERLALWAVGREASLDGGPRPSRGVRPRHRKTVPKPRQRPGASTAEISSPAAWFPPRTCPTGAASHQSEQTPTHNGSPQRRCGRPVFKRAVARHNRSGGRSVRRNGRSVGRLAGRSDPPTIPPMCQQTSTPLPAAELGYARRSSCWRRPSAGRRQPRTRRARGRTDLPATSAAPLRSRCIAQRLASERCPRIARAPSKHRPSGANGAREALGRSSDAPAVPERGSAPTAPERASGAKMEARAKPEHSARAGPQRPVANARPAPEPHGPNGARRGTLAAGCPKRAGANPQSGAQRRLNSTQPP